MSTLDDWMAQATRALDLPADSVSTELRDELLDLTRDVAHGVARIAGPLTCYLVGVAVGRGQTPSAALAALTARAAPASGRRDDRRRRSHELVLLDHLRRAGRLGRVAGAARQATRLPDEHGHRHPRRGAGRIHLPLGDRRAVELRLGLGQLRGRLPGRAGAVAGDQPGHRTGSTK